MSETLLASSLRDLQSAVDALSGHLARDNRWLRIDDDKHVQVRYISLLRRHHSYENSCVLRLVGELGEVVVARPYDEVAKELGIR